MLFVSSFKLKANILLPEIVKVWRAQEGKEEQENVHHESVF